MTIRTVYHASDGTQHETRAAAQRYERATEFLSWLLGETELCMPTVHQTIDLREHLIEVRKRIAERWYLHDRQSPRKRGKPAFTGNTCTVCGGRLEAIAGVEICATCETTTATRLRAKETSDVPAR